MSSRIRVTIWNENVHERGNDKLGEMIRGIYPEGIHGCLAKALAADDLEIRTATLDMPEQGLPAEDFADHPEMLPLCGGDVEPEL